ncbi:MAG: hypothetical protein R3Y24_02795 [Eubacteriales bacterium]
MSKFNYQNLKISSEITLKHISDINLETVKNEHGKLTIKGIVDTTEDTIVQIYKHSLNTKFSLYSDDDKLNPIFSGFIEKVSLFKKNGVDYFSIEVFSGSVQLDRKKKKRSFQDVNMTYADVISKILSEYENGYAYCTVGEDKKIGKPLIQYNETDWEFIKRLASHFESVVVPEISQAFPRIYFGFPNKSKTVYVDEVEYSIGEDKNYHIMHIHNAKYINIDFRFIEVTVYDNFHLGNFCEIDGVGWLLYEKRAKMVKGELLFTYRFGGSGLGTTPTYYNDIFSGMSLLGEVSKTDKEDVYIKLDIDGEEGGEYPYPWRPETGNLMYLMPQVGTKVSLYFPNYDERNAMAVNCFRTNGDTCSKMSDVYKRGLVTEHGKELQFHSEEMFLCNKEQNSIINLLDDKGIYIKSNLDITMLARNIKFSAETITIAKKQPTETDSSGGVAEAAIEAATVITNMVDAKKAEVNMVVLSDFTESAIVRSAITITTEINILSQAGTTLKALNPSKTLTNEYADAPEEGNFALQVFKNLGAGLLGAAIGAVVAVALVGGTILSGGTLLVAVGAFAMGAVAVGTEVYFDAKDGDVSDNELVFAYKGFANAFSGAFVMIAPQVKLLSLVKHPVARGLMTGLASGMITGGTELILNNNPFTPRNVYEYGAWDFVTNTLLSGICFATGSAFTYIFGTSMANYTKILTKNQLQKLLNSIYKLHGVKKGSIGRAYIMKLLGATDDIIKDRPFKKHLFEYMRGSKYIDDILMHGDINKFRLLYIQNYFKELITGKPLEIVISPSGENLIGNIVDMIWDFFTNESFSEDSKVIAEQLMKDFYKLDVQLQQDKIMQQEFANTFIDLLEEYEKYEEMLCEN